MARCATCGNDYAQSFDVVTTDGERFSFDSFECAIQRLAPTCTHCGCRIIGHGIQASATIHFCCAHCARQAGECDAVDNTADAPQETTREGDAEAAARD